VHPSKQLSALLFRICWPGCYGNVVSTKLMRGSILSVLWSILATCRSTPSASCLCSRGKTSDGRRTSPSKADQKRSPLERRQIGKKSPCIQCKTSSAEIKSVSSRLDEILLREEVMWKQRSRIEWLREGDQNTRYFHRKASRRAKKNKISRLKRTRMDLMQLMKMRSYPRPMHFLRSFTLRIYVLYTKSTIQISKIEIPR
jgi:hypothetical protein